MPLTFHYFIFFLASLERGLSLSVFDTYIIEVSLETALSIFQNFQSTTGIIIGATVIFCLYK